MTKEEAISLINDLGLWLDDYDTIVSIISTLTHDSYVEGYNTGYDDGYSKARRKTRFCSP